MNTITTIRIKSKEDALKYAHAFMASETLNMKECSFMNPNPSKFDNNYLMPRDIYSVSYTDSVPAWEIFRKEPDHLSSPSFTCVACLDKKDQQRVTLTMLDDNIFYTFYGNYKNEAEEVFDKITSAYLAI